MEVSPPCQPGRPNTPAKGASSSIPPPRLSTKRDVMDASHLYSPGLTIDRFLSFRTSSNMDTGAPLFALVTLLTWT
ncbi:uncharacterized protein RCC_02691 [Ramularia collo-cygni]|uniref:Uncharacterized protein n=1 Tax=Ramularia collo-cygni TaxID=112498 RepID=A0A2D3V007_9PEZI|nr:uncharacterized protein RCC_02691 [Ramularia collo-cygni]CZT16856.1 uncharacterized protein RCC_02691 [Ramularia collo-cygni]